MVGPDSVVSSAAGTAVRRDDDLQRRRWNDDVDEEETAGATDVTEVDVDVVQLLTRRLSVTPPTDVHCCPAVHDGRQMTASTSTEVDTHSSFSRSYARFPPFRCRLAVLPL